MALVVRRDYVVAMGFHSGLQVDRKRVILEDPDLACVASFLVERD